MKFPSPRGLLITGLGLMVSLAAASTDAVNFPRQTTRWSTQRWGNENANFTFISGNEGRFTASWTNPNGGNFVIGKGLPTRDM